MGVPAVLCLSRRRTSEAVLKEILEMWFTTHYQSNETEVACLQLVREMENLS